MNDILVKDNPRAMEYEPPPIAMVQKYWLSVLKNNSNAEKAFHIPFFTPLESQVNLEALQAAIEILIEHHTALHLTIVNQQLPSDKSRGSAAICILDNESAVVKHANAEVRRSFCLQNESGFCYQIYRGNDTFYLLMVWHHLVFDSYSFGIFFKSLANIYQSLTLGQQVEMEQLGSNYHNFVNLERQKRVSTEFDKNLQFWTKNLQGCVPLHLPCDYPRAIQFDYQGDEIRLVIDAQLTDQLRQLAKEQNKSLYAVMLSAFYWVLATEAKQSDLVIGVPVSRRDNIEYQSIIGLLTNVLALRINIDHKATLATLLVKIQGVVTQGMIHQDIDIFHIVESLALGASAQQHPIFQVMFNMQESTNLPRNNPLPFCIDEKNPIELDYKPCKFELNLLVIDYGLEMELRWSYASSLYKRCTVENLANQTKEMLCAMVVMVHHNVVTVRE